MIRIRSWSRASVDRQIKTALAAGFVIVKPVYRDWLYRYCAAVDLDWNNRKLTITDMVITAEKIDATSITVDRIKSFRPTKIKSSK